MLEAQWLPAEEQNTGIKCSWEFAPRRLNFQSKQRSRSSLISRCSGGDKQRSWSEGLRWLCISELWTDVCQHQNWELEDAWFTGDFGNAYHEVVCRYADVVNYALNEQMLLHVRTPIQSNHSKPKWVKGVEVCKRHEPLPYPQPQELLLLAKDARLSVAWFL